MSLDLERPLRNPDEGSGPLMAKRARWLVVIGFLLPGSAQVLAGSRRLGRLGLIATGIVIVGVVATLIGFGVARVATLTFFTNGIVLFVLQWVLFLYALLWLVLGFDTLRLTRLVRVPRGWRVPVAIISVILTIVPVAGAAWAGSTIATTRGLLGDLFSGAPAVEPVDGRYNILLLGADAGEDREGLRPDSISLVSVDAKTGQSVIIGLPRELTEMPFPESSPMHAVHPNGFCVGPNAFGDLGGCLTGNLNAVFAEVEEADVIVEAGGLPLEYAQLYEGMYPDAAALGSSPGIEATKDAVEGATGLEVQFYVLIDMNGFSHLIDALGGVTITVTEELPIGGQIDEWTGELVGVEGWISPGEQHMDGFTAQW
ncbi:MAG: LCP family protein, partial [Leucobacter sp.]